MSEVLIAALPLLLLIGALLLGRYPGCEAIVRLSERIAAGRNRRRPAGRIGRRRIAPGSFAASGGLLIALGLAQRPPPVAP